MADFIKNNPSLVLDIILIIVLFIYAIKGYIEGMMSSVIGLVGNLGSLIGAYFVSHTYSQTIFDKFLFEPMVKRSYNYLLEMGQSVDVRTALNGILGKMPRILVENIISKAQETVSRVLTPTQESATLLVTELVGPIVVTCISVVVFVLVFIAIKIVCDILRKILKKVNDVPVLGTANKLTGFGIGIVIGCINIILLSFLLCIIVFVTGDTFAYINTSVLEGSKIMALTGIINPFLP